MAYEDEMEQRRHEQKAALVKEIIDKVNQSLDLHFDRMKKYDEEKRELKRKGVRSGMDEALHQITSETMVEVLKENLDLRAALKNYVLLTLRETLLPLLKGEGR